MQTQLNETAHRLIEDQFEGSLKGVSVRLLAAIRFFATHTEVPNGEIQHLGFQNSLDSLYLINDLIERLETD
jgi:hypothetical protein